MPKLPRNKAKSVEAAPDAQESFPVLEPGVYRAKLLSVTVKKGTLAPQWECVFQTVDPPRTRIWENLSHSEAAEWKMKEFFKAFGVPATTDTDELVGETILLELIVGTRQAGKNKGEERNEVARMLPLDADVEEAGGDVEDDEDLDEDLEDEEDDLEPDEDEEAGEEEVDEEDDLEVDEDEDLEEDEEPIPPKKGTKRTAAQAPKSSATAASASAARTRNSTATSPKAASDSAAASRTTRSTRTRR